MASVYLSGILTAWCLTQLALGAFFAFAHVVARRERDLAIFGLMCLSLAYHSASSARAQTALTVADRFSAVNGVITAALLATALNLHFVLTYAGTARWRSIAIGAYVLAAVFEIANATGNWWKLETAELAHIDFLGWQLMHWHAEPTLIAKLGFVVVGCEVVLAELVLWGAYRAGKRESLIAFWGGAVLMAAAVNDMLLSAGMVKHTLFFVPHAFMAYAFTVVSTLVVRYRRTVGELGRAETNLRNAMDELRVSHAELREAQSELTTKRELAAVGELAAAIAHEVRNPLAIIVNAVASLRRPNIADPDRQVLLSIVEEEAERLNRMVTDLLRFARPTSLKRSRVDLPELIEAVRSEVVAPHRVETQYPDDVPRELEADPSLLRVALTNLVQNACQAMSGGGSVEIRVGAGGDDSLEIQVRDRGPGMEASTLARALDPFFTTRPSGTGLGLPIVQRIAQAHGGRLELASTPGEGTTATLTCPLGTGERADGSADVSAPARPEAGVTESPSE